MIGIFDSGLGGLSVLQHVRQLLPRMDIHYVADRARAPYGHRPMTEVQGFAFEITSHLLGPTVRRRSDMIVVACNAASAAALHPLRDAYPGTPFVGMEPAVKPAANLTRSRKVGVLTTAATFQGELFASVVDRYATDISVHTEICDGWVETVERGVVDGPEVETLVGPPVRRLVRIGVDTLVLGCTHYPFLKPVIERIAGPDVRIIDPAPSVARQTARVAQTAQIADGTGQVTFETSGPCDGVPELVSQLIGLDVHCDTVTFGVR